MMPAEIIGPIAEDLLRDDGFHHDAAVYVATVVGAGLNLNLLEGTRQVIV